MKKLLFITLIAFLSSGIYAQLKVLTNGSIQGGQTNGVLRFENATGDYVNVGSTNGSHIHFYTNAYYGYWFDRQIMLGNGSLHTYNTHFRLKTGNVQRLYIDYSTGNVGIGKNYYPSSNFKLDVNGTIAVNHVAISSDQRLKKDIKDMDKKSLSKLYKLEAKTYKFKGESINTQNMASMDVLQGSLSDTIPISTGQLPDTTTNIGLIAQDVQLLFPELVQTRDNGYLTIDYISLIPLLVEALKEQNDRLAQLEKEKKNDPKQKSAQGTLNQVNESSFLGQNQPNPFNEMTQIEYYIPTDIGKAVFYIYDIQGKQISSSNIVEREYGSIIISANELEAGIYLYSIVADGQVIGTEQMILTD